MALTKVTYSMIESAPINVIDFGAVGDGVADDTVAIQAAIDAANGKPVFIPSGEYKITSALTSVNISGQTSPGVRIFGDGTQVTKILNRVAGGACFDFNHSVGSTSYANQVYSQGSYLRGLSILGDAGTANSTGLKIRGLWSMELDQIIIRDHTLYGIHADIDTLYNPDITASVRVKISSSYISYNKIGLYAPEAQALPACKVTTTAFDWNTDIGVLIASNYFNQEDGSISFNGYSYSGDFSPSLSYGGFINPNIANGVPTGNRLVNVELDGNKPQQVFSAVSSDLMVRHCRFGVRLLDGETNKYMVVLGADVPAGVFPCTDAVVENCSININAGDYSGVTARLFQFKAGSRYGNIGNNAYFITGTGLTAGTNLFFVVEDARSGNNDGAPSAVRYEYQNGVTTPLAYDVRFRSGFLYTIADDTVISFRPSNNTGAMSFTAGSSFAFGLIGFVANPGSVWQMATAATGVNLTTGVLTGTTGTDGRLNVSASGGLIYLENRLGSSVPLAAKVLPALDVHV